MSIVYSGDNSCKVTASTLLKMYSLQRISLKFSVIENCIFFFQNSFPQGLSDEHFQGWNIQFY